jgi:hypothetical protein
MLRPDTSPGAQAQPAAPSPPPDPQPGQAWPNTLNELKLRHGALAQLLSRKGRLAEAGESVCIQLGALPDHEERMLKDPRGLAALSRALSKAFGREIVPEILIGKAEAPPPPPPSPEKEEGDQFADEVAAIFGGTLERDDDRLGR